MKIKVQDLGTIQEGEVDLDKNLIVFAGPNNSGKSYMAYLIYGILKILAKNNNDNYRKKYLERIIISLGAINGVDQFLDFNESKNSVKYKAQELLYFGHNTFSEVMQELIDELKLDFFSSKQILPKVEFVTQKIDFKFNEAKNEIERFDESDFFFSVDNENNAEIRLNFDIDNNFLKRTVLWTIGLAFTSFFKNVYFFPAERTALTMVAKEIFKEKSNERDEIASKLLAGESIEKLVKILESNFIIRYPLAINDYLKYIFDLNLITQNQSVFAPFADEIEQMLLEGQVTVSEYGDMRFKPTKVEKALEMHVSSSLVKSLSGLVLYFRHLAVKGDVIMIDEPELNLHPNNQRIVARVLAKAVNKGFKVILSTHSDYIIKEFNNLIMLGKEMPADLKSELIQDLASDGYDVECFLKKDDIGVYLFNHHKINPVTIDDTGIEIETIDEEIDKMNHSAELIYNTLFERQA